MGQEPNEQPWWTRLFGRRTVIAYIIVISTAFAFIYGVLTQSVTIPSDDFVKMALLVLGFYFGSRSTETNKQEVII